jgi:hypothetical protein
MYLSFIKVTFSYADLKLSQIKDQLSWSKLWHDDVFNNRNIFQLRKNTKFYVQLEFFCEKGRIPLFLLVEQLNEIFL